MCELNLSSSVKRSDIEVTDVYMRNADMVYKIAYLYMGNEADAEDILQNVFIKFIKSETYFMSVNHEKAWFITVTKNECKDVIKSVWKSRREDIKGRNEGVHIDRYDEGESAEVLEYLKELKPNYRVTLYLYYYEEYKISEIAGMLSRSESTIQTWLDRGRKKLKEKMGGDKLERII